jgi:hypothetical protein
MGSPGIGVAGAKNDLKNSLDKLDEFNYVVEEMIAVQLCSGLFPGIQYPRVPGHEIAGIIEGVGKDVNTTVIHYVLNIYHSISSLGHQ